MRRSALPFCTGALWAVLLGSAAVAQPAAVSAAPTWRTILNVGLSGQLTAATTVGLERSVGGLVSVGARGIVYSGGSFVEVDDGGSTSGVGAEMLVSAPARSRFVDVRSFVGAGASTVRVTSSSLPLVDPPDEPPPAGTPVPNDRPLRAHLVAGFGLDVYPLAAVGVGVEVRGVVGARGGSLSTVGAGLRVRLGG